MAGADLAAVQRIMRHTDPRITTEFYAHLAPGYLQNAIDRLAFNPKPPEPGSAQEGTSTVIGEVAVGSSSVVAVGGTGGTAGGGTGGGAGRSGGSGGVTGQNTKGGCACNVGLMSGDSGPGLASLLLLAGGALARRRRPKFRNEIST